MQRQILTLFLLFSTVSMFSQGMLYPVSLEEKVAASEFIVEGKVVESEAKMSEGGKIYTHHRVKVYRSFKGEPAEVMEVATVGGRVGDKMMRVDPSLTLHPGDAGIFFLQERPGVAPLNEAKVYKVFASQQGYVKKAPNGEAADVLANYGPFHESFVPQVVSLSGQSPMVVAEKQQHPAQQQAASKVPVINSFTPDTVTAGTGQALFISGSDFGSNTGQAKVEFRNADDGGNSFITPHPSQVLSWTNTEIRVVVPHRAGTGTIRVTDQNGNSATSSNPVIITFNVQTLTVGNSVLRTRQVDRNGSGGLTFLYNSDFATNSNATAAFERALETWRCNTFVNFDVAGNTTDSACEGRDGVSVITWDSDCNLGAGALGRAYTFYDICVEALPQLVEADIVFDVNPPSSWHYGSGNPPGSQNDFESLALHEIGHAHQLGHVVNPSAVMHYSLPTGSARKNLHPVDLDGGIDVMDVSTPNTSCGYPAMAPLAPGSCELGNVQANFTAAPQEGCAPLEVNFTDASPFNPTSWLWDFDNDGTIDDTVQNPTHVYNSSGTYSVMLIASDSTQSDTILRQDLITVYETPGASAGTDDTICSGGQVEIGGNPTATGGNQGDGGISWKPDSSLTSGSHPNPIAHPDVTTTYTVEVINDLGCSAVDSVTIHVNEGASIEVDPPEAACNGDTVVVENTATNPPGTTHEWHYSGEIGDPSAASTYIVATASSALKLVVTAPNGCMDSVVYDVDLNEGPVVDAGDDRNLCEGSSTEVGGDPSATGGAGGYTYLWQPFHGIDNSGDANPSASPDTSITYTLSVFDAIGCVGTDTVRIEVHPAPTADAGPSPDPVCGGEPVQLGGNPTGSGGTGTLNYTWVPTQYIDTINISNPMAKPQVDTVFTVIVTDASGCRAEDSVAVDVLPTPTADAGDPDSICGSGEVTLGGDPAGSGGVEPLVYQWAPSSAIPPDGPNPEVSLENTTSFTLTVTGNNGCADSDSVTITVFSELDIDAGADQSICYGECAELGGSPLVMGGSGSFSITWSSPGGNVGSVEHPEVCPSETTVYTLEITDDAGCKAEDEVEVAIKPFQEISFQTIDSTYCEGDDSDTLVAFPVGGTFTGNGVEDGHFHPDIAGIGEHYIYYEYTTGNDCVIRDSFRTEVAENPQKPSITEDNDTLYTVQGFDSYEWLINGSPIPNSDQYFYVPSESGSYQVRVFNEAGCMAVSDEEDFRVGIEKNLKEVSLQIQPNPTRGTFSLNIHSSIAGDFDLSILDATGRELQNLTGLEIRRGQQNITIDVHDLASGFYLVKLQNEEGRITRKLIIDK